MRPTSLFTHKASLCSALYMKVCRKCALCSPTLHNESKWNIEGWELGFPLFSCACAKGVLPLTLTIVLQERQRIYHRFPLDCEKQTRAIRTPASSLEIEKQKVAGAFLKSNGKHKTASKVRKKDLGQMDPVKTEIQAWDWGGGWQWHWYISMAGVWYHETRINQSGPRCGRKPYGRAI